MMYLVSLLVGVVVGAAYALIGVRSPAPPVVALFGLLGIVIGEQGLPWVRTLIVDRAAPVWSARTPPQDDAGRNDKP